MPREVDKLPGPGGEQEGMGGVGATKAVLDARESGDSVVSGPEGHRPVILYLFSTQNKIKNHFYGTLRNLIRFVLAFFDAGQTCYNAEISHLPPNFLNALYNSTQRTPILIQNSPSWDLKLKTLSIRWDFEWRNIC